MFKNHKLLDNDINIAENCRKMTKASISDKDLILDILCDSFDTNNSVNYVVNQDKNRKNRIRKLMEYSFDMCYFLGKSVCQTTGMVAL